MVLMIMMVNASVLAWFLGAAGRRVSFPTINFHEKKVLKRFASTRWHYDKT